MKETDIKPRIIDYISRNRVSSTEVADCLGKTGAIAGVRPIKSGEFCVGEVQYMYTYAESNWPLHEQVASVREDCIVLVDVFDCNDRAVFGDIVSKYILLYKQAKALVVRGNLRDAHRLLKEGWPIWCCGFTPIGCFNKKPQSEMDPATVEQAVRAYEGTIAVCDDSGVVIIPRERHGAEFLDTLARIEEQEDIWYECIDRRKWSTFDTICLKKYLDDPDHP